jgi:tRNA pseudouridine13 synthase
MKLKSRPEDFRVEELAQIGLAGGPFAVYRLVKQSLGTPEAIEAIARRWRLPGSRIAFAGLKDRHALTTQYVSIRNGPRRNLRETSIELVYLGQAGKAVESSDILANRFEIALRGLEPQDAESLGAGFERRAADGVPNYFDDQRFGSVGESGDFVARAWCLGDFERALWLALADPNVHDRPRARDEKRSLREHWGDWTACGRLTRPAARDAIEHLRRRPHDFRGAFVRVPQPERRMFLNAFQSALWNRVLAAHVRELFPPAALRDVVIGGQPLPFYCESPPSATRTELDRELPLPSARERHELAALAERYERIACEFGLQCRTLRVKYPRDSFFSRGSRPAIFTPAGLSWSTEPDDAAAGRRAAATRKLVLRFELPPGSYATVLIKAAGACRT